MLDEIKHKLTSMFLNTFMSYLLLVTCFIKLQGKVMYFLLKGGFFRVTCLLGGVALLWGFY